MSRLTVIIPGYNTRREWWVRCVRSVSIAVMKACPGEGEIVCVDDGSIVPLEQEWFEGIPDVKIIRLENNSGLPTARNAGLEVARGEFVTFVDSDDEVKEESYARSLALLDEHEADIAIYGVHSVYVDLKLASFDVPEDKFYGPLSPTDVRFLVKHRLFYYSWNKVFRRSFINRYNMRFFPDGVPCEDAIFNVACVVNQAKWVTVGYPGYVYYRYDGSLLSSYKPTMVAGMNQCSAAWKAYKDATPGAYEVLGRYDERSPQTVAHEQWVNIWRRKSPFSFGARWVWLKDNQQDLLGRTGCSTFRLGCEYVKQGMKMWVRAHFYVKPLRKWWQVRCNEKRGSKLIPWDGRV